jgi:CelD/BcsL family acetyltransferase involved in cellulose biosynthesis
MATTVQTGESREAESVQEGGSEPALLPLDDASWAEFVATCPAATPFHHPSWGSLLAETYGFKAFAVTLSGPDGRLLGGAPFLEVRDIRRRRSWISLPFTDECAPLASASGEELSVALAGLTAPRAEIRSAVGGVGWSTRSDGVIHGLDLDLDPERVRRGFSRSQVVRNIARSEKEGVEVRAAASRDDLEVFYGLHLRTRRRQGVPIQPRRFFDLLWERVLEQGLGTILLAYRGETALAGALFLAWNGTTIYKFGASDPEGWPLRPNHLLFWTAIRDACLRGDRSFDFGRTDVDNAGLRAFKSGWGGVERPLVYSTLAPGSLHGGSGRIGSMLEVAIRRGPAWVCRGVGELAYRYAASR